MFSANLLSSTKHMVLDQSMSWILLLVPVEILSAYFRLAADPSWKANRNFLETRLGAVFRKDFAFSHI
jgi:hypothetical protein